LSDLLEKLHDDAVFEVSENPPAPYTEKQTRDYRTYGGAPWLDGEYTVFGEVVEGMKTLLTIEKTKVDGNNRPQKEMKVLKAYVVE
jgi:cyclophilin family peptidyl-prolyl cis-trans isomerase